MITQPFVRCKPTRRRQRFRAAILAFLALTVISLAASAPAASASSISRECVEIKEDYDLRNAARHSNVFVIVHEPDNKDLRESICGKLDDTPARRLEDASEKGKGAVFAYLEISEPHEGSDGRWHEGNRSFARDSLGVKTYPSFLFVSKGMDRSSKFSDHVTGLESLEPSDIDQFIEKKAGFRIGNDVYNLVFFDSLASRFMSYGDATGIDRCKQRILAFFVRSSTLFLFKEPFSSIAKLYNRAFAMSLEHGTGYCKNQVGHLQKKLDSKKGDMSQDEIHEIQQKIAVLRAFAEPKELTPDDNRQIFIHAALHFGLLILAVLLFIVPGDSEKEEEAIPGDSGEREEAVNVQPVVAKAVEGGDDS